MSDAVTLVRWRDAQTDPPEVAGNHATDQGCCYWNFDGWLHYTDRVMDPQPRWWCDPQPPGDKPLTVDDLEAAHDAAQVLNWPRMYRCQDRLRAALDALDRKDTP